MKRSALFLSAIVASFVFRTAMAMPVFEQNLPDFYQHQKSFQGEWPTNPPTPYPGAPDNEPNPLVPGYSNGNWWEDTGGWCRTTAWVNLMYHFDEQWGYDGLFDHSKPPHSDPVHNGKNWLERFAYANEDLAIRSNLACALPEDVVDYVGAYGYEATVVEYLWDEMNNNIIEATYNQDLINLFGSNVPIKTSTFATMFDVVAGLLPKNHWGLVIEITQPAPPAPPLPVWWANFHAITAAGVDRAANQLWWADPNDTAVTANAGADWGHPYVATDPVPVGQNYYSMAKLKADKRTFDNGIYAGARIERIYALTIVPEPSSIVLVALTVPLLTIMVVDARRRHRRRATAPLAA